MRDFYKYAFILLVIAPFIFVLESFVFGAPRTVSQNSESVRVACRNGGDGKEFCSCVTEDFRARLDVNAIALRRILFVRNTVPDKQQHYKDADTACRLKTN